MRAGNGGNGWGMRWKIYGGVCVRKEHHLKSSGMFLGHSRRMVEKWMEAHWINGLTSNQYSLWLLWVPEQVIANGTPSHWHSANCIQTKYIWKDQTQWLQEPAETALIALPPQPEGMQTHSFWHQGDTRGYVLMTLCCHAKKMARLMGQGAGLFLGRIPGSLEPWPRLLLQAMGGCEFHHCQMCKHQEWVETEPGTSPPWRAPFSLSHGQHLAPSFSTKSQLQEEWHTASPSADGSYNWKNTFEHSTVSSEKLELFTGLSWATPFQLYIYIYILHEGFLIPQSSQEKIT